MGVACLNTRGLGGDLQGAVISVASRMRWRRGELRSAVGGGGCAKWMSSQGRLMSCGEVAGARERDSDPTSRRDRAGQPRAQSRADST
jgi:hypothetical protein